MIQLGKLSGRIVSIKKGIVGSMRKRDLAAQVMMFDMPEYLIVVRLSCVCTWLMTYADWLLRCFRP